MGHKRRREDGFHGRMVAERRGGGWKEKDKVGRNTRENEGAVDGNGREAMWWCVVPKGKKKGARENQGYEGES